jgi:outer membrane protein TolC
MIQNTFTPLPDPASSYGRRQAKLALTLEQDKYDTVLERIGRTAATAVDKYAFGNQKRLLAIEAVTLGAERCRIEEIRLNLGLITRLTLMETLIEQTQKEIAVVEAATALLEAEHELERFLDLKPGELEIFASVFTDSIIKSSQSRRKK